MSEDIKVIHQCIIVTLKRTINYHSYGISFASLESMLNISLTKLNEEVLHEPLG